MPPEELFFCSVKIESDRMSSDDDSNLFFSKAPHAVRILNPNHLFKQAPNQYFVPRRRRLGKQKYLNPTSG